MAVILLAFVVVVIGGLSSFVGAVVGGLLVGLVQALSTLYMPEASELVIFLFMAAVLVFRPRGLMGQA
jgi:branched-subunit amino acid ABC-type transport system permease component